MKNLTERETEILEHVAQGEKRSNIAAALQISLRTVNFHVGNATRKLGAVNCNSAVAKFQFMRGAHHWGCR